MSCIYNDFMKKKVKPIIKSKKSIIYQMTGTRLVSFEPVFQTPE